MEKLRFYMVGNEYVDYLREAEMSVRGFSRVPHNDYASVGRKPKFYCGVVLSVAGKDYYVPVSSYKQQKADNFIIYSENGKAVASLRFNYMFPVPPGLATIMEINQERGSYKRLLLMELKYCSDNGEKIRQLAERTYRRVLGGKNPGLTHNSCNFKLLESKCEEYHRNRSEISPSR